MVKAQQPTANGATRYTTSGEGSCYAEFGMTDTNGSGSYKTCQFDASAPAAPASDPNAPTFTPTLVPTAPPTAPPTAATPASGCTWIQGDGVGGSETNIGTASTDEACAAMVKAQQPTANGATRYTTSGEGSCYAEFGMTDTNGSGSYKTCQFSSRRLLTNQADDKTGHLRGAQK
jgi:hypothetical protein